MKFYISTQPVVAETGMGIIMDFGIRKIFPSNSGYREYQQLLEKNNVVAFSCSNELGSTTIFFKEKEAADIFVNDNLKMSGGFAIEYNDTLKQRSVVRGTFFSFKFGLFDYWSDTLFIPFVFANVNDAKVIAEKIKTVIGSANSLNKGKIAQTLAPLAHWEDLGIPEWAYWITAAHLSIYRPNVELYKSFVKELLNCFQVETQHGLNEMGAE